MKRIPHATNEFWMMDIITTLGISSSILKLDSILVRLIYREWDEAIAEDDGTKITDCILHCY